MIDFLPNLFTSNSGSVVGAILLVVYAAITSLRKRRDLTIAELEKKVIALEARIEKMENEHGVEVERLESEVQSAEHRVDTYKAASIRANRDVFKLRMALAGTGVEDPTSPLADNG